MITLHYDTVSFEWDVFYYGRYQFSAPTFPEALEKMKTIIPEVESDIKILQE